MCLYAKCARNFNSTMELLMNGSWMSAMILCRSGINAFIDYKYILKDSGTLSAKANEFRDGRIINKYSILRNQCAIRSGQSIKDSSIWKQRNEILKDYNKCKEKDYKYFFCKKKIKDIEYINPVSISYKAKDSNLNTLYLHYYTVYSMFEHSDIMAAELCCLSVDKDSFIYLFDDTSDDRGLDFIDINIKLINTMFYEMTKELCKFEYLSINSIKFQEFTKKYLRYISKQKPLIDNVSTCKDVASAFFRVAGIKPNNETITKMNDYFIESERVPRNFNIEDKIKELEKEINELEKNYGDEL